jgi:murein DD-endopeptidase MepM/ murein hydrolase activator NlpD
MGRRRSGARIGIIFALAMVGCAAVEPPRRSVIRVYAVDADGNRIERSRTPSESTLAASIAPGTSCLQMSWPVDGPVSSPFGKREGKMHDGIDLAVATDTPVRAACDGVVAYAGNGLRGYGNLVILKHADMLATVYAHNRELLVKEGQAVKRGQAIARSGQTGKASAPHLHFEVRKDSIARNPLGYLRGTMSDGKQKLSARHAPVRQ